MRLDFQRQLAMIDKELVDAFRMLALAYLPAMDPAEACKYMPTARLIFRDMLQFERTELDTSDKALATPEEMAELAPIAQALYQKVLEDYGTKAQMWQTAINGKGQANGQAKSNDHAPAFKRIDTVEQAQKAVTPHCPIHQKPMVYRQGRLGPFWSCPTRKPDGRWCQITKEAGASNAQAGAA